MDLAGKVAIVTGGAMGIGYAICEALAAQGASIVIADLKGGAAAADKLRAKGHKAAHVDADVSSEDDTQRMAIAALDAFGGIDVLVNNAAIYSSLSLKPFEQLTVADWRKMLDVNVIGQFLCCKAVLPTFKKQSLKQLPISSHKLSNSMRAWNRSRLPFQLAFVYLRRRGLSES